MVVYKEIANEPGYRVGSDGSVWSQRNGRWGLRAEWRRLKPTRTASTMAHYCRMHVALGRGRCRQVHRLVLEAFVGPCPPGHEGCHSDGNASNNALVNLRWDSRAGNMKDMAFHGRKKGERHHNATLTDDQVRSIRHRAKGGETHQSIADSLSLNRRNISRIIDRTRWPHVL